MDNGCNFIKAFKRYQPVEEDDSEDDEDEYAEDPSGWTRPKGLPCNTRLQQMDGHFWRVGLDRVSAWLFAGWDPKKFRHVSQHRVRLMMKRKKKKKVKDLVRLLIGFTDKEMEAYARSQPHGHVARFPEWNPAHRTRPKGCPRNTWLWQMYGHFWRVGLERVSAWLFAGRDPKKFRHVLQNQVQLMEKRKKKIKVMDFIEKRMKSCDVNPQGLSKYTDFLLLDCYRLKNVHSIKDLTIEGILQQEVFTFEDMKLVAYVCLMGNWKYEKDFALLPLDMRKQCAKILPSAILSKYGPPSKMRGIYSICHPDRGGVDPSSIFEERKCLVIFPNDHQLMNRELKYIPCLFNRPLGSIIFEEICRFINIVPHSAGVLYYESNGNICRVTEYNVSTYSLLELLFKERIEMKCESKYIVSLTKEDWQGFLHRAAVCYIYVKDHSTATGFLLFDRYILTNAHVIKDIIPRSLEQNDLTPKGDASPHRGGIPRSVSLFECRKEPPPIFDPAMFTSPRFPASSLPAPTVRLPAASQHFGMTAPEACAIVREPESCAIAREPEACDDSRSLTRATFPPKWNP
nr:uncharacterized protein LOC111845758 [Paramormyrops kingsleyae]